MLEGSVLRDQNRACASARSLSTWNLARIFGPRRFEDGGGRPLQALQDQVVARLAGSLGWALTQAEAGKGARSSNPDVIDPTMRGWTYGLALHSATSERYAREQIVRRACCSSGRSKSTLTMPMLCLGSAGTYVVDYFYGWRDHGTDF